MARLRLLGTASEGVHSGAWVHPPNFSLISLSPHLPRAASIGSTGGLAIAGLQPNFDARPLQFKDGTSLEVETLVIG